MTTLDHLHRECPSLESVLSQSTMSKREKRKLRQSFWSHSKEERARIIEKRDFLDITSCEEVDEKRVYHFNNGNTITVEKGNYIIARTNKSGPDDERILAVSPAPFILRKQKSYNRKSIGAHSPEVGKIAKDLIQDNSEMNYTPMSNSDIVCLVVEGVYAEDHLHLSGKNLKDPSSLLRFAYGKIVSYPRIADVSPDYVLLSVNESDYLRFGK